MYKIILIRFYLCDSNLWFWFSYPGILQYYMQPVVGGHPIIRPSLYYTTLYNTSILRPLSWQATSNWLVYSVSATSVLSLVHTVAAMAIFGLKNSVAMPTPPCGATMTIYDFNIRHH